MRLSRIAQLVGVSPPSTDLEVTDLHYDSRSVTPMSLYCCVRGEHVDGHSFAGAAVGAGAAALIAERPLEVGVPVLVVRDTRAVMNSLASPFFGVPTSKILVAGITGTNGKTTAAFMLESIFRSAKLTSGLVGTVEVHVGDEVLPGIRTTPEAIDLQRTFKSMVDASVTHAVIEVTSQGLDAGRVEGCRFEMVAFTNLSQDHLDHHGTMEAYFESKRSLFHPRYSARAAVNIDDPWGRRLRDEIDLDVITYGIDQPADVRALDVESGRAGSQFRIVGKDLELPVEISLPGRFNVSNALTATCCAALMGIDEQFIVEGLQNIKGVPGRFQSIDAGQGFLIIVDYAHSPDGLINVLEAARSLVTNGKLIVVFGCGGDRDHAKRPVMGRVAAERADLVIATSDNPRSEDPLAILGEVEKGIGSVGSSDYMIIPDRREAITLAVAEAGPGDVVVIAGKGHETGQQFDGVTVEFDDRIVAAEAVRSTT